MDENDLDFAIEVFRVGTNIDKQEENSSVHIGTYCGLGKGQRDRMAVGTANRMNWLAKPAWEI